MQMTWFYTSKTQKTLPKNYWTPQTALAM
jgi:hypothetical protein